MASTEAVRVGGPPRKERHDNFDFDAEMAAIFGDLSDRETPRETGSIRRADRQKSEDVLGIDDEVKVKKPRRPIAKLDATRLLSPAGIPKLQKIAKTKLKFRGKGHEFSDVALLLREYQLWLDDLYPRAKFADGLSIIEKVGHTKRMQMERKCWIDESKPKPEGFSNIDAIVPAADVSTTAQDGAAAVSSTGHANATISAVRGASAGDIATGPTEDPSSAPAENEIDDLDALLAEDYHPAANHSRAADQDELDALLDAEQMNITGKRNDIPVSSFGGRSTWQPADLEDDEEALRELEMF